LPYRRLVSWVGVLVTSLTLTVPAVASTGSTYVALGDSYASGAGLGPFLAGSGQCDRSPEAFPEVVARSLKGTRLDFVACAGATIAQIDAQVSAARASLARASLVTLTAGGNDISFTDLLVACLGVVSSPSSSSVRYLGTSSSPANCSSVVASAARLLGGTLVATSGAVVAPPPLVATVLTTFSPLEQRLRTLVQSILAASATPGARVLVVSYPTLLVAHSGPTCRLSAAPLQINGSPAIYPVFTSLAARQLVALNELLGRETAAVVRTLRRTAARLSLVTAPAFVPIDCGSGRSSDLNGLNIASLTSGGSFHPTARGQVVLANAVTAALGAS
jgi:lysophospholipase L1-like esterase